ncbi:hypothetical protein ES319_A05G055100v1 [Gossypium barbadense]|uniref:Uncharacterized protein n=2 Tax=Gossypium TaxID=3633 RepID=A0A5J5VK84_GOSBA|nr:hypothetical protein ES319_A05G055100v1 [Gossypium barbadense]TYH15626.1 hypothetical protein ES288_A05G057000v1 [Gossypium darwinii]
MKMAIGGVAIVATLGYFALYSNKKPEASAKDVAKVTAWKHPTTLVSSYLKPTLAAIFMHRYFPSFCFLIFHIFLSNYLI